jgi:hypothetical protein
MALFDLTSWFYCWVLFFGLMGLRLWFLGWPEFLLCVCVCACCPQQFCCMQLVQQQQFVFLAGLFCLVSVVCGSEAWLCVLVCYIYSGLIARCRDFGVVFNWGVTHIGSTLYFFLLPRALVLLALLVENKFAISIKKAYA